jgi:hypothetical protein
MNMIGVIWKNRAIASAFCFLGLLALAGAQPATNSATNQTPVQPVTNAAATETPVQPVENVVTNQTPEQPPVITVTNQGPQLGFSTNFVFSTNVSEVLAPPVTNYYGAQPLPNAFEAQYNAPVVAGPSVIGSGPIGSPIMGTGVFGIPGFVPVGGRGIYQEGLVNVHAGLSYSYLYGTGIEAQPGQHASTVDQVISPSVAINLGSHWTLSYSAALSYYSGNSGLGNSTGQSVSVAESTIYEGWAFGFSEGYSLSVTPLVQTATETREESYVTTLSVSRQLGNQFSLTGGVNQSLVYAPPFSDTRDWSANGAINYQFNPKLMIGLNFGGGYDDASYNSAMTFESYSAVLTLRPGPKTTVNVVAGIQEESFDAGGVPTSTTPTFSASVAYQILRKTGISISAGRSYSPSFFSNQVDTSTTVNVGLSQYLSRKLNLSVSGSYGTTSYQQIEPGPVPTYYFFNGPPTTSALQVTRDDVTTSIGVSLSYAFRPRWSGSAGYSYSKNSSTQGDYSYSSSQFSVQLSYMY